MKGLMLLMGKGKPRGDEESAPASEPTESTERSYAREAFTALKDDDEDGFVEAFLGAVRACKAKPEAAYDDEEEAAEEDGDDAA